MIARRDAMAAGADIPVHLKNGVYFKDKTCTTQYSDQETAKVLWQVKKSIAHTLRGRWPTRRTHPFVVTMLLVLLVLGGCGIVIVAVVLWWPGLIGHFIHPAAPITSSMNATQAELAMSEQLKNYSERVSDLEKLISVLLGLSTIYSIALGLSSWATVQSNLQQAETWIKGQEALISNLQDQAEESVQELKSLLDKYGTSLAGLQDEINYARSISGAYSSLALAVQGKYISDSEQVTKKLVELRAKYPTDRSLNLCLGRTYRTLGRLSNAIDAMSVYINNKIASNQGHDSDTCDAYYNRACYAALLRAKSAKQQEKDALQKRIEEDVHTFVSIDAGLKADTTTDTDFDDVRKEQWFVDALQ